MRALKVKAGQTCDHCFVIAWGGETWWVNLGVISCPDCGGPMWED